VYELKKIGKVFTSKSVGTGPSSCGKNNLPARGLTKVEKHWATAHCLWCVVFFDAKEVAFCQHGVCVCVCVFVCLFVERFSEKAVIISLDTDKWLFLLMKATCLLRGSKLIMKYLFREICSSRTLYDSMVICRHLMAENRVWAAGHSTRDLWLVNSNRYFSARTFHLPVPFHPRSILIGPGSSVGTATGHGMYGPGIETRWGAKFSVPVQTGPGAHPVSCTKGTGSFRR